MWLSPEQVRVIPISEHHNDYALRLQGNMHGLGIRAQAVVDNDRMNAKIRRAQLMKVPYMLVVGDKEMQNETVSIRRRDGSQQNDVPFGEFLALIRDRIASRSPEL